MVWPGDEDALCPGRRAPRRPMRFVPQPEPLGYGHAIWCAREFVGGEPFLHMVGDHLTAAAAESPARERLVALAEAEKCSVSAVQPTRESLLPRFGTVGGRRLPAPAGPLSRRNRDRKAHAHRGRAAPDGPRHARRLLSLLLRHARAHARA